MILSASRRTDIPRWYSEWFMNRLREGYVLTRNPINSSQLSRVSLSRNVVDCIIFWTKDPGPMLAYLDELDRLQYPYYFQFTLTPYGKDLERNLRSKEEIEEAFVSLSRRLGRQRVIWRYDPIILNDLIGIDDHKSAFIRMCRRLAPYTDTVTISFVDLYAKLRHAPLRRITEGEIAELSAFIAGTAKAYGLAAKACCETVDLTRFGIERASCIDAARIERIVGYPLRIKNDKNQRPGCGCCESIDVGAYNCCLNGCVYCYANTGFESAHRRSLSHDPESPLLIGDIGTHETIRNRAVCSHKIEQISLFDEPVSLK